MAYFQNDDKRTAENNHEEVVYVVAERVGN